MISTFFGEDKCASFVGQCTDTEEGVAELPVLELPLKFTLTVRILEKVGLQHLLVRLTEMSPINSLIATTQVLYEALQ